MEEGILLPASRGRWSKILTSQFAEKPKLSLSTAEQGCLLTVSSLHWYSRPTGLWASQLSFTLPPSRMAEDGSIFTWTPSMSRRGMESRAG